MEKLLRWARIDPEDRSTDDEQKTSPQSPSGVQGQGGVGSAARRKAIADIAQKHSEGTNASPCSGPASGSFDLPPSHGQLRAEVLSRGALLHAPYMRPDGRFLT